MMFKPMPPNKRNELNAIVEKLFQLCSNFTDEPTTPSKLYEEFEKIYEMVQRVRALEHQSNMNRRVPGGRKVHLKAFLSWLDKNGAKIDGVEVADYGPVQGKRD